jgi:hypothetical protein
MVFRISPAQVAPPHAPRVLTGPQSAATASQVVPPEGAAAKPAAARFPSSERIRRLPLCQGRRIDPPWLGRLRIDYLMPDL